MDRATIEQSQALADALYGEGDAIPAHRDLRAKDDRNAAGHYKQQAVSRSETAYRYRSGFDSGNADHDSG